ncbi:MAG: class I SAM-dependent methyltransferase [Microthrixaceae bacterium]
MSVTTLPDGAGWAVDGVTFVFDFGPSPSARQFSIRKPPDLFEMHVELGGRFAGGNIVELGIASGGGTALLALLARPRHLLACELDGEPVSALADLIEERHLGGSVHPTYGIDQSDRRAVAAVVDAVLGSEAIDLVIDDASHEYHATRASFEELFPRLRPGGLFVIEDWAADYAYAVRIETALRGSAEAAAEVKRKLDAANADPRRPARALPRLGVELLDVCGAAPEVVRGLSVNKHWVSVERGDADLTGFRLDDHIRDHWGWLRD